ncbi:hypothetical protein [Blastochloris viridis]|uniref:Heme-binding protein A (HasA) n=1 Tax=Blastochloris viridis TaxID=1079 RepID=A0A0H5BCK9_BLAVI|nr:hypothetical protein [Blastochloris viridis]ALK08674.1 Heme-binding protein A (HasA) [Blastochloris viridis]BAR98031.1 miscellaneous [Blastochloris viridis]CUU41337.1 Heme-binding protein A (HasA) [Blastochloris viridis]
MSATLTLTSASSDLVGYLGDWIYGDPVTGHGSFYPAASPYDQWAGGNTSASVILDGDFTYVQGNLQGTVDTLDFGTGLSGSSSTGFSLGTTELSIDLDSAGPIASFDSAIYGLMAGSLTNLYAYFAEVGTTQIGTSGDDVLYSFAGDDTLTGGGDSDTFNFNLDVNGAATVGDDVITDFAVTDELIVFGLDSSYDSYAEIIAATTDTGAGALIDLGAYGSITLAGVQVADLTTDNFAFV